MAAAGAPQQPGNGQFTPIMQNRPLQIIIGVVIVVAIITGIIFFSINASKDLGPFEPLVQGVDQARALEIAAELNTKGIETEIVTTDTGGVSIHVKKKQMDNAVLEMSRSNLLSTDDFKLFDKTDWAASDYEKRVKYMRAIGGELSRLVSRMDGIRWAKAHVTIPPEKLFTSRYIKDKTSASLELEMEPGRMLDRNQVSSILSLVSGYVPEIEPSRIHIVDTKGRDYSPAGSDENSWLQGASGGFDWAAKSSAVNSTIEKRIEEYLEGVLGPGKSKVAVSTVLTTKKTTQNITKFSPGAIGTHEYSEEALGDAASGSPYTGAETNSTAPQPRPVDGGQWQSNGTEMVDPRLQKDMPPEFYEKKFNNNAFQDPRGGQTYSPCNGSGKDGAMCYENTGRDPSIHPSPNGETQGLYSMGSQNWAGKGPQGYINKNYQAPQANSQAPMNQTAPGTRYACAAGDEVCQRNYRKHNFAIQSYPSYEQTMIESPAGVVSQIRVSVAVEKGSLPVSVSKLKAGIAAAADPNMLPSDVEVILTPSKGKKSQAKKENGMFMLPAGESGGFQWWWIPALILVVILVFLVFQAIGSLLVGKPKTFRDKVPFSPPTNPPKQSNPLDRLDFGNPASAFRDDTPLPQSSSRPIQPEFDESPNNQFNNQAGNQQRNQQVPSFEDEITAPSTNNQRQDLPFDLDDEFSTKTPPAQPQIKPQRQRPKVIIEDNGNQQT